MNADQRRLFFALWPDDATRLALHHWQVRHLPDDVRWTHRDDLHITLHFLGPVDGARIDTLRALAAGLPRPAFELVLDRLGHWPRPQILWVGPSCVPARLSTLHQALGGGLEELGLSTEQRAYRPHITLARKVRRAPADPAFAAITWPVGELTLVESCPGGAPHYRPLGRWPLT